MSLMTAFVFLALGGFAIFGILRIHDKTLRSIDAKTSRKPLTDEQIFALFESVWTDGTQTGPVPPMAIRLSRAIEAAHNIK